MNCPCGSDATFEKCCGPVIAGERRAETAEELMRARYTAYTRIELDFLLASLHPDAREDSDPDTVQEWAENSEWHGLTIVDVKDGGPDDDTGQVEFVATYTYDDEEQVYHELADFVRIDGDWYFQEGHEVVKRPVVRESPKIGRNDPCSCGSGRKYKRCCGG